MAKTLAAVDFGNRNDRVLNRRMASTIHHVTTSAPPRSSHSVTR